MKHVGGCFCGAVRYETGALSGGRVLPLLEVPENGMGTSARIRGVYRRLQGDGEPGPEVARGERDGSPRVLCPECGSNLFFDEA